MRFLVALLLLVITGCQKKSNFKMTEAVVQEDMKCSMFETSLDQYLVKSKKEIHFVKDEAKALEAISAFKIDLTSSRRSLEYYEKMYQDCAFVEGKRLTGCPFHTAFFSFFENLLKAAKTSSWKPETKQKAIALASSYVRFQLKEPQNLSSVSFLVRIVESMSTNGFLKRDLSAEIRKMNAEIETQKNKQWNDLRKTGIGSCEKALSNLTYEIETGEQIVKEMRAWESALP